MLTIPENVAKKIVEYYEKDLQEYGFGDDREVVDFRKMRSGERAVNPQDSDCFPALIIRNKRWHPNGETYYYVDEGLDVASDSDCGYQEDKDRYAAVNCFETEELAREAANKIKKVLQEVHG